MAAICKGRTVIVIAHRLSAVRHAHRVVAMDKGRIVEVGPHEALLRQGGLYAHLWRMQSMDAGTQEEGNLAASR
jgi:subfamily B ATP-binding cassette protein HlyB/CyaB